MMLIRILMVGVIAMLSETRNIAPSTASEGSAVVGSTGTLVVVVPYNEGFVIAADSRSTTQGVACDDQIKLRPLKRNDRAILAATATATWISTRIPLWAHDPCGDIAKNGQTFFDAKELAAKFLEEDQSKPLWQLDLSKFAKYMADQILEVHAFAPEFVRFFVGRTMFQIVLAAYDAGTSTTHVRSIQFNLTSDYQIHSLLGAWDYPLSSAADYPHFGDTETYGRLVLAGDGKNFLPDAFGKLVQKGDVSEVGMDDAEQVAIGMIEAAKLAGPGAQELKSIGGQIISYRVTANEVLRIK